MRYGQPHPALPPYHALPSPMVPRDWRAMSTPPGSVYWPPIGSGPAYAGPWAEVASDASAPTEAAAAPSSMDILSALIPAIGNVTSALTDPSARVARLEAELARKRSSGAAPWDIKITETKLVDALHDLEMQRSREQTATDYANLGRIGLIVAIGVGASIIVFTLSKALR